MCIFLMACISLKMLVFFCRVLHTMFSHFQAHAFARSVTVARSSAVQASSSRRQERRWAIVCGSPQSQSTDLGVVEIAPFPHHCFRTAHPCAQSVKRSPTEPVLSRSSQQRLGHLQPMLTEAGTSVRLSFQSRSLLLLADRRRCFQEDAGAITDWILFHCL